MIVAARWARGQAGAVEVARAAPSPSAWGSRYFFLCHLHHRSNRERPACATAAETPPPIESFKGLQCPIARGLDRVGEWWSILILRDAFIGVTRFEEFQRNLEIAPNTLAKRLHTLVESGLLERRRYGTSMC